MALDEIKQALAADPNYGPAYVLRGLVYMRMNDHQLTEESFRRALQINPNDSDAMHNYGWYLCGLKREKEAVEYFNRAIANPTYNSQAKTLMAACAKMRRTREGCRGELRPLLSARCKPIRWPTTCCPFVQAG
ncbi:MAG: tetratricopeptide repeat protein [Burkholderiaceae bacterium]